MAERPLFVRLNLPTGLEEALESLAREVLRSQPENVYAFAADHFEELIRKRNTGKFLKPVLIDCHSALLCGNFRNFKTLTSLATLVDIFLDTIQNAGMQHFTLISFPLKHKLDSPLIIYFS